MVSRFLSLMCFIWLAVGYTPAFAMQVSSVHVEKEVPNNPNPSYQKIRPVHFHERAARHQQSLKPIQFYDPFVRQENSETSVLSSPAPIQIKEEDREVPPFTAVYIEGPFNVQVHTNKKQKPGVTVRGDIIDLSYIKTHVSKGVLYVRVGGNRGRFGGEQRLRIGSADLNINVPGLHGFTYKGHGMITAEKIHASPLDLSIDDDKNSSWSGCIGLRHLVLMGQGHTKITGIYSPNLTIKLKDGPHAMLRGEANLRCLNTEGDGWLNVYWVKGKNIIIRSIGSTRIALAGTVERLDACFSGKTHFNGRYLRAKETFVKTNDEAVAEITTIGDQHTLARGVSDIYYYNRPKRRTDYMTRNAATLDMRSEELKFIQPEKLYDH